MEPPCWCSSEVHQNSGCKITLTSGTLLGYFGRGVNQSPCTWTPARIMMTLITLKISVVTVNSMTQTHPLV